VSRTNVRVRPAVLDDVPGLVALARAVDVGLGVLAGRTPLDCTEEHLAERLADLIRSHGRELLVAVDDVAPGAAAQVVGLLVARLDEAGAVDFTPVLHVNHLMVAADHRRRGVGRALLAAAVHVAEEHGIDHVVASVTSTSREANRYLARLGFAPLVVARMASVANLRRSLGMTDAAARVAVLRRARLARTQRAGFAARSVRRA
jgi:ribosomal protein S18 acetylase RimI-like enzyme